MPSIVVIPWLLLGGAIGIPPGGSAIVYVEPSMVNVGLAKEISTLLETVSIVPDRVAVMFDVPPQRCCLMHRQ